MAGKSGSKSSQGSRSPRFANNLSMATSLKMCLLGPDKKRLAVKESLTTIHCTRLLLSTSNASSGEYFFPKALALEVLLVAGT
mmetsp:Transcript_50858/g.107977  ORF Transcript_50858/g.107977 Transcript_50858/m.107977 type:complete len:83 (+) Transcript_50858:719-967(+)